MNPVDFIPLILIIAVVYFLILKPQVDERRAHEALVASLAKDDRVVTSSGIHGKVVEVTATTVSLEVAERTRLTVDKVAIARREGEPEAGKASQSKG